MQYYYPNIWGWNILQLENESKEYFFEFQNSDCLIWLFKLCVWSWQYKDLSIVLINFIKLQCVVLKNAAKIQSEIKSGCQNFIMLPFWKQPILSFDVNGYPYSSYLLSVWRENMILTLWVISHSLRALRGEQCYNSYSSQY